MQSCKNNWIVMVRDFSFPNIDWDCYSTKSLDGLEFVKYVQESLFWQYIEGPIRERPKLDLLLGNKAG